MKKYILFSSAALFSVSPFILNADTSYSDYASIMDNTNITGKYLGALEACSNFVDNNLFDRSNIIANNIATAINPARKETADSVRKSIIDSLEKVETDFDLIQKIDTELQNARDSNVDEYYSSLMVLTSDFDNSIKAAEFCLNIMAPSESLVMTFNLVGVDLEAQLNNPLEIMQSYRDFVPIK